jgi:hypothetical protein
VSASITRSLADIYLVGWFVGWWCDGSSDRPHIPLVVGAHVAVKRLVGRCAVMRCRSATPEARVCADVTWSSITAAVAVVDDR